MTLSWAFSIVVRVTSVSYLFSGRQKQGSNVYVGRSTYTLDGQRIRWTVGYGKPIRA